MYENWVAAISVLNKQKNVRGHPKSAVICSKHFTPDNFIPGLEQFVKDSTKMLYQQYFPATIKCKCLFKYMYFLFTNVNKIFRENIECLFENATSPLSTRNHNIMETVPVQEVSNIDVQEQEFINTPKRLCYPGDIPKKFELSSPRSVLKIVTILKKKLARKNKIIKRLSSKSAQQSIKINKLTDLLKNLRNKNYISEGAQNVLKVY